MARLARKGATRQRFGFVALAPAHARQTGAIDSLYVGYIYAIYRLGINGGEVAPGAVAVLVLDARNGLGTPRRCPCPRRRSRRRSMPGATAEAGAVTGLGKQDLVRAVYLYSSGGL